MSLEAKRLQELVQKGSIPQHVAVIMDGNGRWARQRGLPRTAGHRAGVEALKEVLRAARDIGIKYLTAYAFSTENWRRPREEVDFLMRLLGEVIDQELAELHDSGVRLRVIGRQDQLSSALREKIRWAEEKTRANERAQLILAISYGGRAEITDMAKEVAARVAAGQLAAAEVSEALLDSFSYAPDIPDPDLLIRTGGEKRLSNFLLWHLAYTELYFTPQYWPDFGREQLYLALLDFQERERRYGGLEEQS